MADGGSRLQAADTRTREAAAQALSGAAGRRGWRGMLPFLGPAFIASVAYLDPGNFAANVQAGAQFGYLLLWVVIAANLIGILVQTLSAKLGIATGKNLAEHCRDRFPPAVVWVVWVVMEIVAMATDLAEFIGAAVGFNLLFGMPLWMAGLVTAVVIFLILGLERHGFRPLEAVISVFVGVIALCYLLETILAKPDWGMVVSGSLVPRLEGRESVLLAASILGATVMPHVVFLHSALTQGRIVVRDEARMRTLFRYELWDVMIALGLAGLVNVAILIMAAATFYGIGQGGVGTLEEAHRTLEPLLGRAAGAAFAISLLASGLSSASVGTMAGQVIMQGLMHRRIPVWIRRLVTMIPSVVVISIGFEPTRTLVISQVVLSFGLPFAIVPLVYFTRRRDVMGVLVNRWSTTAAAIAVSAGLIVLNIYLLYRLFPGG